MTWGLVIQLVSVSALLIWCATALVFAWRLRRMPLFEQVGMPQNRAEVPGVTVIVAARNQAESLIRTIPRWLAQENCTQVVVIADRSTDDTVKRMQELGARDSRLVVVNVTALPPGWIGKTWALHQGFERATAPLVLMTDADTEVAPGALVRAAGICASEGLDHLAVIPQVIGPTRWLRVFATALRGGLVASWGGGGPATGRFLGIGPFNLVRREAFAKTAGFDLIRMEVLDDMGVGMLMAGPGLKHRYVASSHDVAVAWYPDAWAMMTGLRKNAYGALADYSPWRAAGLLAMGAAAVVAPWLSPAALITLGPAVLVALAIFARVAVRRLGTRWWAAFLLPLGLIQILAALAGSMWAFHRDGGVVWATTLYPADQILAGRRVVPALRGGEKMP